MPRPRPDEEAVREQLRGTAAPESESEAEFETETEAESQAEPEAAPGPESEAEPEAAPGPASEAEQPDGGSEPDSEEPTGSEPEPKGEAEDMLRKAERERAEYLDLAQRTRAELDNFRKRAARDSAQAGERAKANLVRELLPVLDNLERALYSAGDGEQHLAEGVRMVHAQLVAALEREGIESFDPVGDAFDPACHEALSTRQDGEAGRVLDVVEKGYRLNGTVLRPARVVVSA